MTSHISYTRGSCAAVLQRMLVGSLSLSNMESISKKGALQDVNKQKGSHAVSVVTLVVHLL